MSDLDLDDINDSDSILGSESETRSEMPDADELSDGMLLNDNTEISNDNTRLLNLINNAKIITYNDDGDSIEVKDANISYNNDIAVVSTINTYNTNPEISPVPDTINSGNNITYTNQITTDNTSNVIIYPNKTIVGSPKINLENTVNNYNGIADTSINYTNSSTTLFIEPPRRIARVYVPPAGAAKKVIQQCTAKTLKGTQCSKNAVKDCKYCKLHYTKAVESGTLESTDNNDTSIPISEDTEIKLDKAQTDNLNDGIDTPADVSTSSTQTKNIDLTDIINNVYTTEFLYLPLTNDIYDEIYKYTINFYNDLQNINTIANLNSFIQNLNTGYLENLQEAIVDDDLKTSKINIITFVISQIYSDADLFITDEADTSEITGDTISDVIYDDTDLELILSPNLIDTVNSDQLLRLQDLDSEVSSVNPNIHLKNTVNNDVDDDENKIETSQMNTSKKFYKPKFKLISKVTDTNKFKIQRSAVNLGASKIIADPLYKPVTAAAGQIGTSNFTVSQDIGESELLYKYRSNFTTAAYKKSDGNIKWDSCVVLGKMKINKIMYGLTYDDAMESLLAQI
jgi:hypothetical protein